MLKGHPFHRKSDAELRYIVKDASEAAECMRNHDALAEGKYLDQANDAATILYYRQSYVGGNTVQVRDDR